MSPPDGTAAPLQPRQGHRTFIQPCRLRVGDFSGLTRTMRILLVEDEPQIADFVARGLFENGYSVDTARDGVEALEWPSVAAFDIIILDVMLPYVDGIEVCRTLRAQGLRTPILMLTARDAVEDRVRGLDSGADDYLVKPFAFAELLGY